MDGMASWSFRRDSGAEDGLATPAGSTSAWECGWKIMDETAGWHFEGALTSSVPLRLTAERTHREAVIDKK